MDWIEAAINDWWNLNQLGEMGKALVEKLRNAHETHCPHRAKLQPLRKLCDEAAEILDQIMADTPATDALIARLCAAAHEEDVDEAEAEAEQQSWAAKARKAFHSWSAEHPYAKAAGNEEPQK